MDASVSTAAPPAKSLNGEYEKDEDEGFPESFDSSSTAKAYLLDADLSVHDDGTSSTDDNSLSGEDISFEDESSDDEQSPLSNNKSIDESIDESINRPINESESRPRSPEVRPDNNKPTDVDVTPTKTLVDRTLNLKLPILSYPLLGNKVSPEKYKGIKVGGRSPQKPPWNSVRTPSVGSSKNNEVASPPPPAEFDDLISVADDRESLFSEPVAADRRALFDELSYSSIPGNLHLGSDGIIERFVQKYGTVNVIRQLASDLAAREAEVGLLRRQHDDREKELRRMLVQCGVSISEIDKRLMNIPSTAIMRPDHYINELMHEAIHDIIEEDEPPADSEEQSGKPNTNNNNGKKSWVGLFSSERRPLPKESHDDLKSIAESTTSNYNANGETYCEDMSPAKSHLPLVMSSNSSIYQNHGPMELNDIHPENEQPPTLLKTWNDHYGSNQAVVTDRFGFIYANRNSRSDQKSSVTTNDTNDSTNNATITTNTTTTAATPNSTNSRDISQLAPSPPPPPPSPAQPFLIIDDEKGIRLSRSASDLPTQAKSAVVSRPQREADDGSSVKLLLSQLTNIHDGLQKLQTSRWDDFLRKLNSGLEDSRDIIQSGQLLGVSGTELLSSGRKGGNGKGLWKEFKDLVLGGVPIAYRPRIWGECSGAWTLKVPGVYDELVNRTEDSEAIAQIELDLYRTMPYNVFFGGSGPGVNKLRRVLVAFSRRNPEVGYCQGMNMIAAILLLTYATEEDAFWSLVSLVENILPEGFFSPPLLTSRADQRVFSHCYFPQHLPKLQEHFDSLGVEVSAVTFDWFLSCFTDALPAEVLFRVWDVFLCVEGLIYLFRIALALFKIYEKQLLQLNTSAEVYSFIKNIVNQPIRVDELIQQASLYASSVVDSDLKQLREKELKCLDPHYSTK
ncbi:hypothetical protein TRVA0_066S00166 [Trichomonascus vanleenenianus]|uniref:TBC domain-containing protein n=1 Tax=Trichomonascus vanleenenianus TaxID=2268995 RepID=UPI003ECA29C7